MAPVTDVLSIRIDRKIFPAAGSRAPQLVLKDVAFEVARGSFVVITGPSGCGKSTLLNIIAGLDRDFDGTVDLAGTERLGYVFQTPRLLPWRTVEENIALALPEGDPRRGAIPELIGRVGLTAAANAYPERLSVGMQRRVALARGFVIEPDLLLMDEPFVSLDDPTAEGLRQLLIDLWNRILTRSEDVSAPSLLHDDMDLTLRSIRDLFTPEIARVVVDRPSDHKRILEFVDSFAPALTSRASPP